MSRCRASGFEGKFGDVNTFSCRGIDAVDVFRVDKVDEIGQGRAYEVAELVVAWMSD